MYRISQESLNGIFVGFPSRTTATVHSTILSLQPNEDLGRKNRS